MNGYLVDLAEAGAGDIDSVGGKAASLGELARIEGVSVPGGFCVTTEAFRLAVREGALRFVPGAVAAEIVSEVVRRGDTGWAVRSSATAEDLPDASFAGQHESFLDVAGAREVLEAVRRCWASLHSERAVAYRERNGIDGTDLAMAVIVQEMVPAEASGVLFTAHPLTSNRRVASVEAVTGLGEQLVAGRTSPATFEIEDGQVTRTADGPDGAILDDRRLLELVELGRRIEAHFGQPQDIEWCFTEEGFRFVQSRPITTIFPLPEPGDSEPHVYVSVGHQQMMTDAIRPLGLSFWQMTAARPMLDAGGRLFVDVTPALASPVGREQRIGALGYSDPLVADALDSVLASGFVPEVVGQEGAGAPPPTGPALEPDPEIPARLIAGSKASLARLTERIRGKTGTELLELIRDDLSGAFREDLFSAESLRVLTAVLDATRWLNENLEEWLGEKNAVAELSRSVPGNVSAEMGLELLNVADAVRPHPEVVGFLEKLGPDGSLDGLAACDGGIGAERAIRAFLEGYGMRCAGEIDITRTRWSENPADLIRMILHNVRNAEPGAADERFESGRRAALAKRDEILRRVRELPDGETRAAETEAMVDRLRNFAGYREYPKYGMVSRYFVYKRALLEEAARLVGEGVIETPEDIYYLRFEELEAVVRDRSLDPTLVPARRREFARQEALTPPRVMTSDGETFSGSYRRQVPEGTLAGLGVSAGLVEGRARVIDSPGDARLEPGDILITSHTDPSWTPVFVGIAGLVTEVGGMMSHGAVVTREYGLPAVVAVESATTLIPDGGRIRIDGTAGTVELLES